MRAVPTVLTIACLAGTMAHAQAPFKEVEYVDVGNIKASVALHGDLWWIPDNYEAACEFPKGSGKHANHISALWFSGYDVQMQLKTSIQTYRQDGNDLWPGPIAASSATAYTTAEQWARIWKVNKTDITSFLAQSTHTLANTPAPILEWPAKNNANAKGRNGATLTITTDMAPFVDVDKDGKYDPLKGDYPDIKGDQMLWWIFNDSGPVHDNTQSLPLGIEVKAKAYAYSNSTMGNVIFYEYDITNKSALGYTGFRCGLFSEADLGYYNDDYIGFDSTRRMAFSMNGDDIDGGVAGNTIVYGNTPPLMGVTLLEIPGDNATKKQPAGSFIYFNNDFSGSGNPQNPLEYNYLMRSAFRDGQHLHNDFVAATPSYGRGAGPDADYVFPGIPGVNTGWSECAGKNVEGDRRFVLSTNDYELKSKATTKLAFALVITDTSHLNICDSIKFTGLQQLADSAIKYYAASQPPPTGINHVAATNAAVYPNPAQDALYISEAAEAGSVMVYDIAGRTVTVQVSYADKQVKINMGNLAPGTYSMQYLKNGTRRSALFVKD